MDNMTEEEKKMVDELKRRTIKDVTPKMLEDVSVFYRFAKARDFNLADAEDMLRKHIAWRKEFQVDTILTDYEPPEVLVKYLPSSFVCFDKKGCVVLLVDAGRLDANGVWNVTNKTELEKYAIYILEQDIDRMIQRGGNLKTPMYLVVYDFEGLTYSNAVSIKTAQNAILLMKMLMNNYPEMIRTWVIINAPFYFSWIYALVKPLIPPMLLQKVKIYAEDGWKEFLLEEIAADDLPAYLGGNRTDPDGNPLCETIIKRGQPVPKSYSKKREKKLVLACDDTEKISERSVY